MTLLESVRRDAEYAFGELTTSLEGVTERQSWAALPQLGSDYLHTDGSIYGITLHIASGKWINGSVCFRDAEIRWRDCVDQIAALEPSWDAALDYLRRGHEYWIDSWSQVQDLEEIRPTTWKEPRPVWRILQILNFHDTYHAGQIAMLRHALPESDVHPSSVAEDLRTYCPASPWW